MLRMCEVNSPPYPAKEQKTQRRSRSGLRQRRKCASNRLLFANGSRQSSHVNPPCSFVFPWLQSDWREKNRFAQGLFLIRPYLSTMQTFIAHSRTVAKSPLALDRARSSALTPESGPETGPAPSPIQNQRATFGVVTPNRCPHPVYATPTNLKIERSKKRGVGGFFCLVDIKTNNQIDQ